jgi:PPM family protein phosphatase
MNRMTTENDSPTSKTESPNAAKWFGLMLPASLDSPPQSVKVEVQFGARSQRSPQRPANDDHYLILRMRRQQEIVMTSLAQEELPACLDESGYGMAVADGIGGDGEAASRMAISALVHLATYFGRWHLRVDEPIAEEMLDRAKRFYRGVDATIRKASLQSPRGLQTTLTAVYTAGAELFFAHVGHSRAYVLRDDQLMQLTRDHTLNRRRPGIIDMAAGARDAHHIVTQALGWPGPGVRRIDVERCGLMDGDVVLLCTNGLTDVADDARIANALRLHTSSDAQCQALVDLAANSGSHDDVTVLVARYRIGE